MNKLGNNTFLILSLICLSSVSGFETLGASNKATELNPRFTNVVFPAVNTTILATGTFVIGTILLLSVALYSLDVLATERIDDFLFDFYGPEEYEYITNHYAYQNNFQDSYGGSEYHGARRLDKGINRRQRQLDATEETVEETGSSTSSKVFGWIRMAYSAYNAANQALKDPECRRSLVCEVFQRPDEVLGTGYVGQTIKKGIDDYLPLIQEKNPAISDILDAKKDAEENPNKECSKSTSQNCSHLQKFIRGSVNSPVASTS